MLYLVPVYLLLSVVCLITGTLFHAITSKVMASPALTPRPLIVYAITGLVILTGIGQWLVLITPLQPYVSITLLLLLLLVAAVLRKKWWSLLAASWKHFATLSPLSIPLLAVFGLMVALLNAGPLMMDDSESYHIQMVKWIQEYGTVPGLANLHLRYGFNSSWFTSIGLLSPHWNGINTYTVLNGVLSWWCCQYFLEKLLSYTRPSTISTNPTFRIGILVAFILALITWPMIRGNTASLNYDFITCVCVLILGIEAFSSSSFQPPIEWVLWPCFLFTVRITNFPLLLLAVVALVYFIQTNNRRQAGWQLATGVLLVTPFLMRNVLLSGYLFYPVYQLDLFTVDWKVDRQMTHNIVEYIKYYNRVNVMHQPLEVTRQLGFPHWISDWFRHLFAYDKPVMVLGLLSIIIGLFRLKTIRRQSGMYAWLFFLVMVLQLISWFFIAPDPRFVYGPLLMGILVLCASFPAVRIAPYWKTAIRGLVIFIAATSIAYAFSKPLRNTSFRNWWLPRALPVPPVKEVKLDGITLHVPEKILGNWNARCYGNDLPCLYKIHPGLRARGKDISDGFYVENKPGSIIFEDNMYLWY